MTRITAALVLAALLTLATVRSAPAAQTTANFNTDPGWEGVNNTSGDNNFGWSNTNYVGGAAAGEIGGVFDREAISAYYAVPVTGLSANNLLQATGRFGWREIEGGTVRDDGEWNFGWFNSDYPKTQKHTNGGIAFSYNSRNFTVRIYYPNADFVGGQFRDWRGLDMDPAKIASLDGCMNNSTCPGTAPDGPSGGKNFNFTFDPNANGGLGRITMLVTADNGATNSVLGGAFNLRAGEKAILGTFDRFGLFNSNDVPGGGTNRQTRMWIDDVTYTSSFGPVGIPGDYNANGVVDAADYVVWRNGGPLMNEGASLGAVNQADYDFWRANFGKTAVSGATAPIPEPTVLVLLAISWPAMVNFVAFHHSSRCRNPQTSPHN